MVKRIDNLFDVTARLIGEIRPVADSRIDEVRYQNLEDAIKLTEQLICEIHSLLLFKDWQEHSCKKAGERAAKFLEHIRDEYIVNQPLSEQ